MSETPAPYLDGLVRATGSAEDALAAEEARAKGLPEPPLTGEVDPSAPTPVPPQPQPVAPAQATPPPNDPPLAQPSLAQPAAPPPAPEPPAPKLDPATLLAEKFGGDIEKLTAAYSELEHKQSQPQPGPFHLSPDAGPAAGKLDFGAMSEEFIRDGKLSDERHAELRAVGLDDQIVQTHTNGLKAQRELVIRDVNEVTRGPENWQRVVAWAAAGNVSDADMDVFNAELKSGHSDRMLYSMRSLMQRFDSSAAGQRSLVEGAAVPGQGGIQPFTSRAEMMKVMEDPRYSRPPSENPAFHREFDARLAASDAGAL